MSWEAWTLVVLCVTSAAASPLVIGERRTAGWAAWNIVSLLFFAWLVLRMEGVT